MRFQPTARRRREGNLTPLLDLFMVITLALIVSFKGEGEAAISIHEATASKSEKQLAIAQRQQEAVADQLSEVSRDKEALRERSERLQSELDKRAGQLEELSHRLGQKERENLALSSENGRLDEQNKHLTETLDREKQRYADMSSAMKNELDEKQEELLSQIQSERSEKEALRASLEDQQADLQKNQERLQKLELENKQLSADTSSSTAALERLGRVLEERKKDLQDSKPVIPGLEKLLGKFKEKANRDEEFMAALKCATVAERFHFVDVVAKESGVLKVSRDGDQPQTIPFTSYDPEEIASKVCSYLTNGKSYSNAVVVALTHENIGWDDYMRLEKVRRLVLEQLKNHDDIKKKRLSVIPSEWRLLPEARQEARGQ